MILQLLALLAILSFLGGAIPSSAAFIDKGGFFPEASVSTANERIRKIEKLFSVHLEILTYGSMAEAWGGDAEVSESEVNAKLGALRRSMKKGEIRILLSKSPGLLAVLHDPSLQKTGKFLDSDSNYLQTLLANQLNGDDRGKTLERLLEVIESTLDCNSRWNSAQPCQFQTSEQQRPLPKKRLSGWWFGRIQR